MYVTVPPVQCSGVQLCSTGGLVLLSRLSHFSLARSRSITVEDSFSFFVVTVQLVTLTTNSFIFFQSYDRDDGLLLCL